MSTVTLNMQELPWFAHCITITQEDVGLHELLWSCGPSLPLGLDRRMDEWMLGMNGCTFYSLCSLSLSLSLSLSIFMLMVPAVVLGLAIASHTRNIVRGTWIGLHFAWEELTLCLQKV